MFKQYIKQAFQMLKENRLVSSISIIGTAISITMIMMVVLVLQVQVANYYPEEHRDRMLFVEDGTCVESEGSRNNGNMSDEAVRGMLLFIEDTGSCNGLCSCNRTSINFRQT